MKKPKQTPPVKPKKVSKKSSTLDAPKKVEKKPVVAIHIITESSDHYNYCLQGSVEDIVEEVKNSLGDEFVYMSENWVTSLDDSDSALESDIQTLLSEEQEKAKELEEADEDEDLDDDDGDDEYP